jgi:hypothetical protein
MMIYHITEKPKVINLPEELDTHLKTGWIQTPIEGCETIILQRQIAFHKAEIERLNIRLGRMNFTKDSKPMPEPKPESKPEPDIKSKDIPNKRKSFKR